MAVSRPRSIDGIAFKARETTSFTISIDLCFLKDGVREDGIWEDVPVEDIFSTALATTSFTNSDDFLTNPDLEVSTTMVGTSPKLEVSPDVAYKTGEK